MESCINISVMTSGFGVKIPVFVTDNILEKYNVKDSGDTEKLLAFIYTIAKNIKDFIYNNKGLNVEDTIMVFNGKVDTGDGVYSAVVKATLYSVNNNKNIIADVTWVGRENGAE